jgi:hypothetical protein
MSTNQSWWSKLLDRVLRRKPPMDEKIFVDRILENENLTSSLVDEDANWLLKWGTGQVKGLVQGIGDVDAAGEKVNALMAVMRKMNRLVGEGDWPAVDELVPELQALAELSAQAFGTPRDMSMADWEAVANQLVQMTPSQALQFLAERFASGKR